MMISNFCDMFAKICRRWQRTGTPCPKTRLHDMFGQSTIVSCRIKLTARQRSSTKIFCRQTISGHSLTLPGGPRGRWSHRTLTWNPMHQTNGLRLNDTKKDERRRSVKKGVGDVLVQGLIPRYPRLRTTTSPTANEYGHQVMTTPTSIVWPNSAMTTKSSIRMDALAGLRRVRFRLSQRSLSDQAPVSPARAIKVLNECLTIIEPRRNMRVSV